MTRPIIGVTTRRLDLDGRYLDVAEREYSEAIGWAGGRPRLLPRPVGDPDDQLLTDIDGLLLTGGGDIDPRRYGAVPSDQVGGIDVDRDLCELDLVRAALDRGLPVLGICRGCQLLNVALGGTLHQHLPDITAQNHLIPWPRDQVVHEVTVAPDSQLATVLGSGPIGVNSIHHQAVDRCGRSLVVVARSEDGIVEAVECVDRPVLGLQWHPEDLCALTHQRAIFRWLVQRASASTELHVGLRPAESSSAGGAGRG